MRIRCIGYIINLIVQAFLFIGVIELDKLEAYNKQEQSRQLSNNKARRHQFRLLGLLSKGHNIVVHIRSLSGRTAEWKELTGRIIPIDNHMR